MRRQVVPSEDIYFYCFKSGEAEREKANASCSWRCSGTSGERGKAETEARSHPDKEICHHLNMNLISSAQLLWTLIYFFLLSLLQ